MATVSPSDAQTLFGGCRRVCLIFYARLMKAVSTYSTRISAYRPRPDRHGIPLRQEPSKSMSVKIRYICIRISYLLDFEASHWWQVHLIITSGKHGCRLIRFMELLYYYYWWTSFLHIYSAILNTYECTHHNIYECTHHNIYMNALIIICMRYNANIIVIYNSSSFLDYYYYWCHIIIRYFNHLFILNMYDKI